MASDSTRQSVASVRASVARFQRFQHCKYSKLHPYIGHRYRAFSVHVVSSKSSIRPQSGSADPNCRGVTVTVPLQYFPKLDKPRRSPPRSRSPASAATARGAAAGRGSHGHSLCMREAVLSMHTWHPTLRALGVVAMQRGGCLDVQEHTRNARSLCLV